MAPSTFAGRMFCIFYALAGIPLCMLTLKVMGDKINELLGSFFIMIGTKRQLREGKRTKIKVMSTLAGIALVFLFLGGSLYLSEDWSYFDGVYYCFIGKVIVGDRTSIEVLEFHSLFIRRISFIIYSEKCRLHPIEIKPLRRSSLLLRFHLPLIIRGNLGKVV